MLLTAFVKIFKDYTLCDEGKMPKKKRLKFSFTAFDKEQVAELCVEE
jgi:hypothetical protein